MNLQIFREINFINDERKIGYTNERKNFFKKQNKDNFIDKNLVIPKGFTTDNRIIEIGDRIFHKKFGEGVVVAMDDDFASVAFDKKIGIKDLVIGHSSWVGEDK